ncbi:MAG: ADP-ribosylglycohydrolase family protein [bacterium]|nr:ADP-ribosylglycohydrolase family protein [bacterium]
MMNKEKIRNSILGLILGDALGVPVEFKSRTELDRNPVLDMIGYGAHKKPMGTWSDDSSMSLITLESLSHGYDLEDVIKGFCKWAFNGYMTPYGKTFSIGKTTLNACKSYKINRNITKSGGVSERSNGNGSLMRILPVSIYFSNEPAKTIIEKSFEVSALTHNHIRSKIACALYSLFVSDLLKGKNLYEALANANRFISPYIPNDEKINFNRIINFEVLQLNRSSIKSTGYVIDTLEASLWCLFNTTDYKEAVLKAVNLGDDTDTTAAVTGGLAGIVFGLEGISSNWLKSLAKIDKIEKLIDDFLNLL